MDSDLDFVADVQWADAGVRPGGDKRTVISAVVAAVDGDANRVSVSVNGGVGQWLPALPGLYEVNRTVWVSWNPITSRSVLCLGPVRGYQPIVAANLSAIDTGAVRGTVDWQGTSYVVPYVPSTYTVGQPVWVGLDPTFLGRPYLIVGPATLPPAPVVAPPTATPVGGGTVTLTATVFPEFTGTWRSSVSRWNDWNANRYGRDVLYQGNGYGSGPMTGLAAYGGRITDIGATTILETLVTLRGADISAGSYPDITLQCASDGSQPGGAPAPSGDTANGSPGRAGVWQVALTGGMNEALRTGGARGICTVGGGYAGVRGTGAADGMALNITYTRPA